MAEQPSAQTHGPSNPVVVLVRPQLGENVGTKDPASEASGWLLRIAARPRVAESALHQAAHILEADVAVLQLFVIEDADAALAEQRVALECEVDFLDAVAFGAGAESGPRSNRVADRHAAAGPGQG